MVICMEGVPNRLLACQSGRIHQTNLACQQHPLCEAAYCLHAAGGPLEASTCGCFYKPFRSLNAGVKGWGLTGRHGMDCRGPNNAAKAHLVTDGDVNTLFVHKIAVWVPCGGGYV